MRPWRVASAGALLVVALIAAACGENSGSAAPAADGRTEPAAALPADPGPGAAADTGTVPVEDSELEAIVRAWSAALNAGDNEAAADLFAPDALVVQGGVAFRLGDRAAAIDWNAGLPCSGTIVELEIRNGIVIAVFALGDRPTSPCDAPAGTLAAAAFLIENGKIAVWQQIPPPEEASPERAAAPRGIAGITGQPA